MLKNAKLWVLTCMGLLGISDLGAKAEVVYVIESRAQSRSAGAQSAVLAAEVQAPIAGRKAVKEIMRAKHLLCKRGNKTVAEKNRILRHLRSNKKEQARIARRRKGAVKQVTLQELEAVHTQAVENEKAARAMVESHKDSIYGSQHYVNATPSSPAILLRTVIPDNISLAFKTPAQAYRENGVAGLQRLLDETAQEKIAQREILAAAKIEAMQGRPADEFLRLSLEIREALSQEVESLREERDAQLAFLAPLRFLGQAGTRQDFNLYFPAALTALDHELGRQMGKKVAKLESGSAAEIRVEREKFAAIQRGDASYKTANVFQVFDLPQYRKLSQDIENVRKDSQATRDRIYMELTTLLNSL